MDVYGAYCYFDGDNARCKCPQGYSAEFSCNQYGKDCRERCVVRYLYLQWSLLFTSALLISPVVIYSHNLCRNSSFIARQWLTLLKSPHCLCVRICVYLLATDLLDISVRQLLDHSLALCVCVYIYIYIYIYYIYIYIYDVMMSLHFDVIIMS